MRALPFVFAGLAVGRSLGAWVWLRAQLVPDLQAYLELGLYPAPFGTLLGSTFGAHGLAIVNALAAGALVLLAAELASELGGSRNVAAAFALLMPACWWPAFNGVDALGAALVLGGLLASLRGWNRLGLWLGATAAGVHLAALPLLLAGLAMRRGRSGLLLAAVGLAAGGAAILVTPYRGLLGALSEPRGALWGVLMVAAVLVPLTPVAGRLLAPTRLRRPLIAGVLATVVVIGAFAAIEGGHVWLTRYALPVSVLASAVAAVRVPA